MAQRIGNYSTISSPQIKKIRMELVHRVVGSLTVID